MGTFAKSLITAAFFLTLCNGQVHATNETPEWPEKVVSIKEVRPVEPFKIDIKSGITKGKISGPVVVLLHINNKGEVAKAKLFKTCGNTDLDESALHAARHTKFSPYQEGGIPSEVTLILPINIPKKYGRSW
jgi:TonB family protein